LNILLAIVVVAALVPAAGLLYQALASRLDRRRFPMPGRLVDAGVQRVHLYDQGRGAPPVVLEAGIAASSVSWEYVRREVARFARTISYDRAGYGWSDAPAITMTPETLIGDLHAVLAATGAGEPCVIVGHSFGGLLARLYAHTYPTEVAGLVLVDPALTSEWRSPDAARQAMLERGVRLSGRGAVLARFGVVRLGLTLAAAGARPLAKLVARASSRQGGQRTIERLIGEVRKLPADLLPVVRAHWSRPSAFEGMAQHLAMFPDLCAALPARAGDLGSIPLIVISGAHLTPEQQAEQAQVARLSTAGRHIVAEGSGHWVHLDRADLVVQAVREVVETLRSH
jgi:pimeloyl-ACP methyl ester carboxylesterase